MKTYEVFGNFETDKVTVFGNWYDVTDGYLDVYISDGDIAATFCPGHWKAIITIHDDEA